MHPTRDARQLAEEVADRCIASRVRMLSRVMTGIYQEELRPHGLTAAQFNILTALALTGDLAQSKLAVALRLEKSTVSRNVALMVENGWVVASGAGRGMSLSLSTAGASLFRAAHPAWARAQTRAAAVLGETATRAMNRAAATLAGG
jgi:DNA-binding MarR family transcriptional regulator